ncbi:SDR family oxidoreductase [Candidatus Deferrimicrobium sp.]|uniref:SDR family oxidoreductase n=1 Tax=Candidatus Deferrimicrobium sp. TaxID=3060586 RepID=UPI002ED3544E
MAENGKIRILLPGPTSYLGRRLMLKLLDRPEVRLRVLVMDRTRLGDAAEAVPEIVEGDPLDPEVLQGATEGIDVAFYPLRFVGADEEFEERRRVFPGVFRDACIRAGVQRIIFLGSFNRQATGSEPLKASVDTGGVLSAFPDRIRTVWFRAGLIVGSSSLLFETLTNLAQKMPVLPTPRWMEPRVTVIGIRDVLEYLIQAIHVPVDRSVEVEIGLEPRSFRDMLSETARIMGLRRVFLPLPIEAKRLSPVVLMLLSPFSIRLATLFLQLLDTVGKTNGGMSTEKARRLFPEVSPAPFHVVVARAIDAIEDREVISRWTDSIDTVSRSNADEEISRSMFRDIRRESFGEIPPQEIFRAVKSIGGEHGWFRFDLLWRIRGLMDKLAGGFGDSLGRRTDSNLRVGDILDFWRVIDLRENRRLLLEAHMKVAGKAWLEFRIEGNTLVQTAYHYPKGLLGRLYWYSMLPFHAFIFPDMIRSIIRQAGRMA